MVENMHDVPYVRHIGPEITAAMTVLCSAVKSVMADTPVGCQVWMIINLYLTMIV